MILRFFSEGLVEPGHDVVRRPMSVEDVQHGFVGATVQAGP